MSITPITSVWAFRQTSMGRPDSFHAFFSYPIDTQSTTKQQLKHRATLVLKSVKSSWAKLKTMDFADGMLSWVELTNPIKLGLISSRVKSFEPVKVEIAAQESQFGPQKIASPEAVVFYNYVMVTFYDDPTWVVERFIFNWLHHLATTPGVTGNLAALQDYSLDLNLHSKDSIGVTYLKESLRHVIPADVVRQVRDYDQTGPALTTVKFLILPRIILGDGDSDAEAD